MKENALREHQLKLLELLSEFDAVCSRLGITWWLDSGTLLGAVREGGFIPWDDDLDVCILAEDYPKIKRLMRENLREPFEYQTSTKGQTRLSPRFVNKSRTVRRIDPLSGKPKTEALWVDTFVLRRGSLKAKRRIDPVYGRCLRRINGSIRDGAHKLLAAYLVFPFIWAVSRGCILWGRLFHPDTLLQDFGVPFYTIRDRRDIFPLSEISFEGRSFPAPHDTDAYLRKLFGAGYMTPPDYRTDHNILF